MNASTKQRRQMVEKYKREHPSANNREIGEHFGMTSASVWYLLHHTAIEKHIEKKVKEDTSWMPKDDKRFLFPFIINEDETY